MAPKIVENSIEINAPASFVWDALINPMKTRVYMFGCETVSDWEVGRPLKWKGIYEGVETTFVKGFIVEINPYSKLVYSTFDPNATMEDIPENYLNVTYLLHEKERKTTLTVTQGDYATVAEGDRRFEEASNNGEGWNPILVEIKKLVESIHP